MAVEVFANSPVTTITSGGTDAPAEGTQETFTVFSASPFPAASSSATPPTWFHFVDTALPSELMTAINTAGDTWTVIRGAESTATVAHVNPFTIYQVASAGALTQLRSTDWLNVVTQFGADPTNTNDSTTVIQAALNSFPSYGGTLYVPAGTYKISSALTVPSYVTVQGAGNHATVFSQVTANTHGIYALDQNGISLRDFGVTGPGDSAGTGNGIHVAISVNGSTAANEFRNLLIKDFGNEGFYLDGAITSYIVNVETELCAENGFNIINGTSLTFIGCYANNVSGYGYFLDNLSYSSLDGCGSDFGITGYRIQACRTVALNGCGAESQSSYNFEITGSNSITLNSCEGYQNPNIAFWVTGSSADIVMNACLERNPAGGANYSFQVDSGSSAVITAPDYVTGMNLTAGTTTLITPGTQILPSLFLAPTGATGETAPRREITTVSSASLSSGDVYVNAIALAAGTPVNNISLVTGPTQFPTAVSHGWYCLCDNGFTVRSVSLDQTAGTTWTATATTYTLSMTASSYVTTYTGLYYVGVMVAVASGSMPTFCASGGFETGFQAATSPVMAGIAGTGKTTAPTIGTALAAPAGGNIANSNLFYAYTS